MLGLVVLRVMGFGCGFGILFRGVVRAVRVYRVRRVWGLASKVLDMT